MGKSVALGCIVLILVGVLVIGGMAAGAYNRLNAADQAVSGGWAQVENVYQRRADLIPNLVETVKGAANFEKETLTQVIQARASATQVKLDANSIKDPAAFAKFQQAQDGLGSALGRLLVSVEKYPELKANQNYRDLQAQLEGTENRIAVERGRFNDVTQAYNTLRRSFPTVIVANFAGFKERPYFKAAEGSDKPPAVKF
ncbi:MAG TPA: LemA family protein [Thermoanaerobaculia bacterium]|nr:LemA family protein [Thermoanaerobaculia bacterium]